MTIEMIMKAMYHSVGAAGLGLSLLMIGALALSFVLNDQKWPQKLRNIAKFMTAIYGVAAYYSYLAFMNSAPLPVSLWLAATAALPAIIAGDILGLLLFRHAKRRTLTHMSLTLDELAKKVMGPRPALRWWMPLGVGLMLIAAALACTSDLATLTPTAGTQAAATASREPATGDPAATQTAAPTEAATGSPGPGQPATPRPLPVERLSNPGFEGDVRPVIFPEVNVYEDWEPYYCDEPYTPEKCPAERRDTQTPPREGFNEPGLMMGRPEFKPSGEANRVHGGSTAQQWFCFFRVCRAGVSQVIQTNPGEVCQISAWVMTWSAGEGATGTDGQPFTSWTASDDDRANSTWFIRVDPDGGTFAFTPGLLVSQPFTYDFGHYDRYVEIHHTFTATGNQATIFFENLRLWPFPHNDSYLDDASVVCGYPDIEATPTPGQGPTPTRTPTATGLPTLEVSMTPTRIQTQSTPAATPLGGVGYPRLSNADIEYVMIRFANIRNAPSITGLDVGDRLRGDVVRVRCFYEDAEGGDEWASEQECSEGNKLWTARLVGGLEYMQPVTGPVGR
jgi:hypothetical protein